MRNRFALPALFFLTVLTFFIGIWEPTGLTGKDEFYLGLRTPMEMMQGHHWLVPFLDGAPRIKKPPLLYWLGRVSYETFGVSLLSARMIGVLFAALLVVSTAGIARRLTQDRRVGLVAGLILLGMLGLQTEARRFMLDVPVAALSCAALWAFLTWLDRQHWAWLTLTALLLAAGFLVKGPVVFFVCGAGIAALLWTERSQTARIAPHWRAIGLNALLLLALALPWFVVVRYVYPEAANLAFADELESRQFFHPSFGTALGLINIGLPWTFVFLAIAWKNRRESQTPRLLLIWFAATTLPFFLIRSFDRYLLGSLIPMAMLLAWGLPNLKARWPFRLGLAISLLAGIGLAAFDYWFNLGAWYWLVAPSLYFAWAWWSERGLGHMIAAPAVFWIVVLSIIFPALGVNAVPPEVVELGRKSDVAFYDGPQPALLPILTGRPHRHYADLRGHAAELHRAGTLVFAEAPDVPQFQQQLAAAGFSASQAGSYKTLASHGSGLRFARAGATSADWREAFAKHNLSPLMTTVAWFRIEPLPAK